MPNTIYWYCCYCQLGGNNITLVDYCPSCGHKRDTCCPSENFYASECTPRCGTTHSVCSDDDHKPLMPPPTFYPPPVGTISEVPKSTAIMKPTIRNKCCPSSIHDPADSNPQAATNFGSMHTPLQPTHGYGPIAQHPEGQQTVDYIWYCCNCGSGPLNAANDKGCPDCSNHWRCASCIVEQIVRLK